MRTHIIPAPKEMVNPQHKEFYLMHYIFDMAIASTYGIDVAVFLQNIAYWVKHNKANKTNFHEGKYWTYNSLDAFVEIFPCWNRRQVEYLIKKCVDQKLILKGNFNQVKYDRTLWYTLSDIGLKLFNIDDKPISQNCEMDETSLRNEVHEIVTPIPDVNTDIETNIKNYCATDQKTVSARESDKGKGFDEFWNLYPNKKDKNRALRTWKKLTDEEKSKIIPKLKEQLAKDVQYRGDVQYIPMPSTYLNGKRWEDDINTGINNTNQNVKSEIKSTVKEWAPGNPDYDRVHGNKG